MKIRAIVMIGLAVALASCAMSRDNASPSNLTPGMAKRHIIPGQTTQVEVMEIFGPPDLVTRKNGTEVWTYDKISQEVKSSSGYLTIILAGLSRERMESHNKSIMLIIYFDSRDRVTDYRLSAAKF